jgi:pantetheine-phosphate adenylyltransferase, bacterial
MIENKLLYAGTFDPVTNGHLDVIKRAANLCGKLVIGVMDNSEKRPKYTVPQRIEMLGLATEEIENVEIISYSGLLADYVNENNFFAVVRGLRAAMDFEYEIRMAQLNAKLFRNGVETIFLMTNPVHSYVNSSIVKEVFELGGNIEGLVPPKVYEYMKNMI